MNIIIAGDYSIYPTGRHVNMSGTEIADCMKEVKSSVESADCAIVNLETAVLTKPTKGIDKVGALIGANSDAVDAIKSVGFNVVTLANNHFADYGQSGVEQTLSVLDNKGIMYVGGGKDEASAQVTKYITIDNRELALINCCEHEFHIAHGSRGGANGINITKIYRQIVEAKNRGAVILVIIHGGHEHYQLPSPRMQQYYRMFIEFGADAVVNHHQHCYSGYEIYHSKPIFYGLGNFLFDSPVYKNANWNNGYMISLNVDNENVGFTLIPYIQSNDEPKIHLLTEQQLGNFYQEISNLNEIISDEVRLKTQFINYANSVKHAYLDYLQPHQNKWLRRLKKRGLLPCSDELLPTYFTKQRILYLLNDVRCESHKDIFEILLENYA